MRMNDAATQEESETDRQPTRPKETDVKRKESNTRATKAQNTLWMQRVCGEDNKDGQDMQDVNRPLVQELAVALPRRAEETEPENGSQQISWDLPPANLKK
jgi:hypothetical protein